MATKHQPDLIMCRKLVGVSQAQLCSNCEDRCVCCDSFVKQKRLVRLCEDCGFGALGQKCLICGGPGSVPAYYCKECVQLEKDRDGCPRILNLGAARLDRVFAQKQTSQI